MPSVSRPGRFTPRGRSTAATPAWQTPADKAAAAHVFALPVPNDAVQTAVSLAGTWQYAGDDEAVVEGRLEPIHAIPDPATLNWHALAVPGDRNQQLPGETYIHRYYLRTRVQVPAEALPGGHFVLHVPGMSVVASVLVNGRYCGGTKNCWAVWDCDVTRAIRPGEVNEVVVALKDAFYALSGDKHPNKLDYIPYSFWHYNTDPPAIVSDPHQREDLSHRVRAGRSVPGGGGPNLHRRRVRDTFREEQNPGVGNHAAQSHPPGDDRGSGQRDCSADRCGPAEKSFAMRQV